MIKRKEAFERFENEHFEGVNTRMNYFDRQFLRASDFDDEQTYFVQQDRLNQWMFHTAGIGWGRQLWVRGILGETTIVVKPGAALDEQNRFIALLEEKTLDLPMTEGIHAMELYVAYKEEYEDPSQDPGVEGYMRVHAYPEFIFVDAGTVPENALLLAEFEVENGVLIGKPHNHVRQHAGVRVGIIDTHRPMRAPALILKCDREDPVQWPELVCNAGSGVSIQGVTPSARWRRHVHHSAATATLSVTGVVTNPMAGTVSGVQNSNQITGTETDFGQVQVGDAVRIFYVDEENPENSYDAVFLVNAVDDVNQTLTLNNPLKKPVQNAQIFSDYDLMTLTNGDGVNKVFVNKSGQLGIGTEATFPLSIQGSGAWSKVIGLLDNQGVPQWHINQTPPDLKPGLNFAETEADNGDGRLFLQTGGRVGIGTTNPLQKLQIGDSTPATFHDGGNKALSWNAFYDSGCGWRYINTGFATQMYADFTSNLLQLNIAASGFANDDIVWENGLTIFDTGNITIGGAADTGRLSVHKAKVGATGFEVGGEGPDGAGNSHIPYKDGNVYLTGNVSENATGDGAFNFRTYDGTAYDNKFYISGKTGNVGIGTVTPNSPLDVKGNISVANDAKYLLGVSTVGEWIQNAHGIDDQVWGISIFGSYAERMRILNTGNVGIGTTTPQTLLDVAGDIQSTGGDMAVSSSNKYVLGYDGSGFGEWIQNGYGIDQQYGVAIFASSTERMRIVTNTGHVGIGTTTPASMLQIKSEGTSTNPLSVLNSQNSNNLFQISEGGSNNANLYLNTLDGTRKIQFATNGSSYFTGGNVGIGTATPDTSYALDITGNVRVSGTVTASNIPANGGSTENGAAFLKSPQGMDVIAGRISESGEKEAGEGFTVSRTEKGNYLIKFDKAFAQTPTIVAVPQTNAPGQHLNRMATVMASNESGTVFIRAGLRSQAENSGFHFVAMGTTN